MKLKYITILAFILLIEGCSTYAVREHTATVETINKIKEKHKKSGVKINIGSFASNQPDIYEVLCRLAGPIALPNGKSFNSYIIDALKRDMEFAGIYSKDSSVTLNAYFEKIDFSSVSGAWVISVKFYTKNNNYFQVDSEYKFDSAFKGTTACGQVSEAFPKAVEAFIVDTISHPEFARIMSNR